MYSHFFLNGPPPPARSKSHLLHLASGLPSVAPAEALPLSTVMASLGSTACLGGFFRLLRRQCALKLFFPFFGIAAIPSRVPPAHISQQGQRSNSRPGTAVNVPIVAGRRRFVVGIRAGGGRELAQVPVPVCKVRYSFYSLTLIKFKHRYIQFVDRIDCVSA